MNETPNPLVVVERAEAEPVFVADTPVMKQVREALERAAETDVRTILYGEVGVGKSHAARYLHATSLRKRGPLVGLDLRDRRVCAVLADADLLDAAAGGTLVLRAVDDASSEVQGLLVGLIEAWSASEDGEAPVRVVATGRRDLLRGVEEGWFRKDLYYLLDVFPVVIPPLRERVEEISALLEHFFGKHGTDRKPPRVPDAFLAAGLRVRLARQRPGVGEPRHGGGASGQRRPLEVADAAAPPGRRTRAGSLLPGQAAVRARLRAPPPGDHRGERDPRRGTRRQGAKGLLRPHGPEPHRPESLPAQRLGRLLRGGVMHVPRMGAP